LWLLLIPVLLWVAGRVKSVKRGQLSSFLIVGLGLLTGFALPPATRGESAGLDVSGIFTIVQDGTPDPAVTTLESAETENAQRRWHAFNIRVSGNEVEGSIAVVGSTAVSVGTFRGSVAQGSASVYGTIKDVDGRQVADVTGQVTRTGLEVLVSARNGERAAFSFAPPNLDAWAATYDKLARQ
jgi:hypothetical protein